MSKMQPISQTHTTDKATISPVFPIDIDVALRTDRSNWPKMTDRELIYLPQVFLASFASILGSFHSSLRML